MHSKVEFALLLGSMPTTRPAGRADQGGTDAPHHQSVAIEAIYRAGLIGLTGRVVTHREVQDRMVRLGRAHDVANFGFPVGSNSR